MLIDAHQHYWNPARGDHDWMPRGDAVLDRPYRPADLSPVLARHGIASTVLVQAAATVNETEYLLGLADATPSVGAVVGWVDFENRADLRQLERLRHHPLFRGVRPMIQDIPDDDWMLRADVQWGFQALADLDLTFDALGFPRHLANFHSILTRYPGLRVVIDHGMKPRIRDNDPAQFRHWAAGMSRLAADTGACVKLSGLMTEDGPGWSVDRLRPYAEHMLDAFGPARVMWGSDWPVCRLRAEYEDWYRAAQALTGGLSAAGRAQVFGGTAAAFYRIA